MVGLALRSLARYPTNLRTSTPWVLYFIPTPYNYQPDHHNWHLDELPLLPIAGLVSLFTTISSSPLLIYGKFRISLYSVRAGYGHSTRGYYGQV